MKRIAAALFSAFLILVSAPASPAAAEPDELTIATFNASLNRSEAGQLVEDLPAPTTSRPATWLRRSSDRVPTFC